MEKGWVEIYFTAHDYKANIAKGLLDSEGINSVIINRKDSVYPSTGLLSLYVEEENEQQSKEILKDLIKEDED